MLQPLFYPWDEPATGSMDIPEPGEIAGLMVNNGGGAAFRSYQVYGINANSENKGRAWAFLKFMLSEEMQLSLKFLGYPVHEGAFVEQSKINMIKMPNYLEDGSVDSYMEMTDDAHRET